MCNTTPSNYLDFVGIPQYLTPSVDVENGKYTLHDSTFRHSKADAACRTFADDAYSGRRIEMSTQYKNIAIAYLVYATLTRRGRH